MSNAHSSVSRPRIALLGTGIIGAPVAKNLHQHGFPVRVWNRTLAKAEPLSQWGIQVSSSVADAVQDADVIVTVLKDGPAVLQAMNAGRTHFKPGAIWVQLSTVGIDAILELAAFAKDAGLIFYDAPILGTRQPAEQGQLVILAAGPIAARATLQPLFEAIGKRTIWLSEDIGVSSRLKLALNNWVFTLTHGVAESLALAQGLGVDPRLLIDTITGGPLDCGYFQLKAAAILADDYTTSFSVSNATKDAELVVAAATASGVTLDVATAGLQRFRRTLAIGHGDKDMAASFLADTPDHV